MIDNILSIVLGAAYWLLMPAALVRFQMQVVRAPFRNPVGQFVCALTDWLVKPLRRVLPGSRGYDWASLAAAVLLELLNGLLYDVLSGHFAIFRGAAMPWLAGSAFGFLAAILTVALWCVILAAVMSWVRAESPIIDILDALVNPWLRPIRRRMPLVGGFDLSPIVLMVLLQIGLVILQHARPLAVGALTRL